MSNIIDKGGAMNEKMKQARLDKNLSQTELAKSIGVSRQTINMIENDDYNPTVSLCIKICKALDKTLDELFWRE
jgi:putative transcriptional regulator